MQERGDNGFRYPEVAAPVGMSHVAVHRHFKTSADFGSAAMAGHTASFVERVRTAERDRAE